MTRVFFIRCADADGVETTPDGESFDTFDAALAEVLTDCADGYAPPGTYESAPADARDADGYRLDVPHVTGPVYRCAIVEASPFSDAVPRDDAEALAYLQHDGGAVPCSRYGRDSSSCAPVALLAARIMERETGEPMTFRALDSDMGLVVNDSDDVASVLHEYATDDELDSIGYGRRDLETGV